MAKRSGGPKTPAGKFIASRNSLKTGAYSAQQFLPGERPEEFDELQSMFVDDFQPVGAVEASLVREIAILAWKKLRLERVENQYLYGVLNATPTAEEFFAAGLPRREDIVWLLKDLSAFTPELVESYRRYLGWAQAADKAELTQDDIDLMRGEDPDLYAYLKHEVSHQNPSVPAAGQAAPTKHIIYTWRDEYDAEKREVGAVDVKRSLANIIACAQAVLYVHDHWERITEVKGLIRDRRLKEFMESPGPIRAYQDLSRAFFRVLAELRRQQEWRLKNRTLET